MAAGGARPAMTHSDLDLVRRATRPSGNGRHRHKHRQAAPTRSRRGPAALIVVFLMLGLLVGGVWYGGSRVLASFSSTPDYPGPGSGSVLILIKRGDSATAIGKTLVLAGVVRSTKAFANAATADPRSGTLQPGTYRLLKQMKASQALQLLLDPASRVRSRVTLPEGLALAQTLVRISQGSGIALADLQAAVANPAALGLPAFAKGRLEGFLFPATYDIEPASTATVALKAMVTKFDEVAAAVQLESRAKALGLSPYEVMVVASLVEREGRAPEENPKIARVIYNRLDKGMALQIDASVLYGLGRYSGPLTEADLKKPTAYNTRINTGLPPTPIAAPGQGALEAALAPAAGNWLYYVLMDKQGHQLFTNDYNAFLKQKAKSQQEGLI